MIYVVCKFWPDQGYSSVHRRFVHVAFGAKHRLAPVPRLATLPPTVPVSPAELPRAA